MMQKNIKEWDEMAVGYGKGVIDIIYNFILENLENESKKTPKKNKRAKRKKEDKCEEAVRKTKAKYEAAASKAGEKCEKIEDIDWRRERLLVSVQCI